jgi:hypothetical protein
MQPNASLLQAGIRKGRDLVGIDEIRSRVRSRVCVFIEEVERLFT